MQFKTKSINTTFKKFVTKEPRDELLVWLRANNTSVIAAPQLGRT
jgi:hypothetical protein